MRVMQEFKEFAVRGNVIDLAVGVIVGGAFGKIVDSLVGDVVMPLITFAVGGKLDFTNLFIALAHVPEGIPMTLEAVKKAGVPVLAWGNFVTICLNFMLMAIVIFLMVKKINALRASPAVPEAPEPPAMTAPSEEVLLLREIRDQLKR